MFFDDRLATVLRQRAQSEVGQRAQFRQLLDILGPEESTAKAGRDPAIVSATWMRMNMLASEIPSNVRASIVADASWKFNNPELATHLADSEPDVASAALNRAQLSSEDWLALIPRLPVRARGFLRLRKDLPVEAESLLEQLGVHDRGLPSPANASPITSEEEGFTPPPPAKISGLQAGFEEHPDPPQIEEDVAPPAIDLPVSTEPLVLATNNPEVEPQNETKVEVETEVKDEEEADPVKEGRSEISALVERIAQFKRTRNEDEEFDSSEPRLPLGEEAQSARRSISAFGFAADAAGRIEWSDGEVASMIIGTRLTAPTRMGDTTSRSALEHSFRLHQPIRNAHKTLNGAPSIAGEWVVDAQPRFTQGGNFSGYIGRFRRVVESEEGETSPAQREADRIRQLLHELRTPVTAVQGYAEVIQQQLFGLASHEYRALAAAIAADAARILAGFEELDQLAKLETGAKEIEPGEVDLAELADRICRQLEPVLRPRLAGVSLDAQTSPCMIAIEADQAEGLIWRLLATLGGGCTAGEVLNASLLANSDQALLTCELPTQLLGEEDIFAAEAKPATTPINAGLFGAGFALRLARAEAKAAGGDLRREEDRLTLLLPLLHSETQNAEGCAAI